MQLFFKQKKIVKLTLAVVLFFLSNYTIFAQSVTPVISDVKIIDTDKTSAVINWTTDIDTDSLVNYGLNPSYGIVRDPVFGKNHSVKITDLLPFRSYFFRVVSSDKKGNNISSGGYVFKTTGSVSTSDIEKIGVEETGIVQAIIDNIEQLTSPTSLKVVLDSLGQKAEEILKKPSIIGSPKVTVGPDFAKISWLTDRETNSMVFFETEKKYDKNAEEPFVKSQGNPNDNTKEHIVEVKGLNHSTVYYYQVSSEDEFGLRGVSLIDKFVTKSPLPKVSGVRVIKIQETSATVVWSTDVPAEGTVEYTNTRTNEVKSKGDPTLATSHIVQINDLEFGTKYSAVIKAINQAGDVFDSDAITFVTVRDRVAPVISKVNNESTLFPGADTKIQTIIVWDTDEPAYCQFFYNQGLIMQEGSEGESLDKEKNPVTEHVQVILGFAPATVYKFWMKCEDHAGNSTKTEDFVLFTPQKEKSIIDIILENFEGTFGWVKNITN